MADETLTGEPNRLELATELTIAWLANPNTRASAEEVPTFLQKMYGAVSDLSAPKIQAEEAAVESPQYTPAVSVRRSLSSKEHIISMIDGKPYKTLKRHLSTHGLTPAEYRTRYNLKSDYPMVAENYGAMRREMAKKIGLGRKAGAAAVTKAAPTVSKAPTTGLADAEKLAAGTAKAGAKAPAAKKATRTAKPAVAKRATAEPGTQA